MAVMGLDAVVVLSADQHLSEYIADHWKFRQHLSGFSGSAGTLVVTADEAGLWTDSRYFLQAQTQLQDSGIQLFRTGEPGVPEYKDYLATSLMRGSVVGLDGRTMSMADFKDFSTTLRRHDIRVDSRINLMDEIWFDREPIPEDDIFELELDYAGMSRMDKAKAIMGMMRQKDVTHYLVCALDEIAWMLNLRGSDVPFNPVFHAFMIVSQNHVNLFIDPHKLTATIGKKLDEDHVRVFHYADFYQYVRDLPVHSTIYYDPQRTNVLAVGAAPSQAVKIEGSSFITTMKGVKNGVEIAGSRRAHLYDGVAMVKFLCWLDRQVGSASLTELSCAAQLLSFRQEQPGFVGESFGCIAAYGSNGAIVHYSPTPDSNRTLEPHGFFLLDSGGQYLSGTTDITRTIAMGSLTNQQKIDYTLVLKGHIALSQAVFPEGTRGVHLDILARQPLWQNGLNYGHGTGHGVGAFLNVHEGPQSIRPQDNGVAMQCGMITSNEPALYRQGEYGIRIENLILCVEKEPTQYGRFLQFDALTLCPIDLRPVEKSLLTQKEIEWINAYHQQVSLQLSPLLSQDEQEWLANATATI